MKFSSNHNGCIRCLIYHKRRKRVVRWVCGGVRCQDPHRDRHTLTITGETLRANILYIEADGLQCIKCDEMCVHACVACYDLDWWYRHIYIVLFITPVGAGAGSLSWCDTERKSRAAKLHFTERESYTPSVVIPAWHATPDIPNSPLWTWAGLQVTRITRPLKKTCNITKR